MKILLILTLSTLLATLATVTRADSSVTSQYRGYAQINSMLAERVYENRSDFELSFYIGERNAVNGSGFFSFPGLTQLLGMYDGAILDSKMRNSEPNAINLIIWQLVFGMLGDDIAAICDPQPVPAPQPQPSPSPGPVVNMPTTDTKPTFRPEFVAAVKPLCAWNSGEPRDPAALFGLWTSILSFDAPEEEFQAWSDFFLNGPYRDRPAREAIAAMSVAAMMNPYFLLEK